MKFLREILSGWCYAPIAGRESRQNYAFLRRLLIVACLFFFATAEALAVHVKGYTRKDGTYVQPHERTAPNKNKNDNYSTRGNVNPYTGKAGTKPRDGDSAATPAQPANNETPPAAPPWKRGTFADLKSGMSESAVKQVLGSPREIEGKADFEAWTYSSGTVFVKSGSVVAWKETKTTPTK